VQYLFANASAMGRPRSRDWLWKELSGDVASVRPLRTRQHAFQLEIDGQLLVDRWAWVDAHEPEASRAGCRRLVVVLEHTQRPALEPSAAVFHVYPRGLDPARRYRVMYDSASIVREVDGGVLLDQGPRVQVPGAYTSELLLFEEIT